MEGPSTTGDAAADAAAAGAASAAPAQSAAEREVERREAQRLFGVLAEAAGGAMYDRLIGLLADKLPDHVVMRRGPRLDEKAALVARARILVRQRPLRVQLQVVGQGGGSRRGSSGGGGGSNARVKLGIEEVQLEEVMDVLRRHEQRQRGGNGSSSSSSAPDGEFAALLQRQAPPPLPPPRRRPALRRQPPQRSVAEVLSDSWQEDADVNAQLGALVSVFGEAVLRELPLGHLPCFNL